MRIAVRRWYIVLPALLTCAGLTLAVYAQIPTRYESTGAIVLTSPASGGLVSENPDDNVQINPLLAFEGSLTTTAQVIVQHLGDPRTQAELGAGQESTISYTVDNGETNGPFVFVVAASDSATASEKMAGSVLERARHELADRQRELGAPKSTFITSQTMVAPTKAEALVGGKVRYAGAAFVLGLVGTALATFAADSLFQALARRRSRKQSPNPTEDAEPGSAPGSLAVDDPARAHAHDAVARRRALAATQGLPRASEQTLQIQPVHSPAQRERDHA